MIWVVHAEPKDDYKLLIEFNDGTRGIIDLKNKIETDHREIIRELIDREKFKALKVERHTVCWKNGVDFAPEYLYEQL
jgi:uncharacterized protein YkvS